MTGPGRHFRSTVPSCGHVITPGAAAGRLLRGLKPLITLKVVLRALLGVLLFFGGIVFGVWLIIRFRKHHTPAG